MLYIVAYDGIFKQIHIAKHSQVDEKYNTYLFFVSQFLMLLKVALRKIFPFDCDKSDFITENDELC